jgi:hypothetical protein
MNTKTVIKPKIKLLPTRYWVIESAILEVELTVEFEDDEAVDVEVPELELVVVVEFEAVEVLVDAADALTDAEEPLLKEWYQR